MKNDLNIVIVGHVDHGKSTVIGRLMADTGSLPEGKLEQVKQTCQRNARQFEYAYLLDALKEEQAQGITIDTARCFFETPSRRYMILDAPGHVEFLKNMITGAAKADAALLVVDAYEGIQENTRRHAYMLSLLGISEIIVLVNKMDMVGYSGEVFSRVVTEFSAFAKKINMHVSLFVPISAIKGDNIAAHSDKMDWYSGACLLDTLDSINIKDSTYLSHKGVFRMYVQGVYKFTEDNDFRRIIAGTIDSGSLNLDDKIIFYPSGKSSKVKTIEGFNRNTITSAYSGQAVGFTLKDQLYIRRGEIACKNGEQNPIIAGQFKASVFWLGKNPLVTGKKYKMRFGTMETELVTKSIISVLNSSDLSVKQQSDVLCNEVGECIFSLREPIAFDKNLSATSRFVIVDEYDIVGGGIIRDAVYDERKHQFESNIQREYNWERSYISDEHREIRYGHKSMLVLLTGPPKNGKTELGKTLEQQLFNQGKHVFYIGMSSILYGLNLDIHPAKDLYNKELIRRVAEVANILLGSGMILIMSVSNLGEDNINLIRNAIDKIDMVTVWVDKSQPQPMNTDLFIPEDTEAMEAANYMLEKLSAHMHA